MNQLIQKWKEYCEYLWFCTKVELKAPFIRFWMWMNHQTVSFNQEVYDLHKMRQ